MMKSILLGLFVILVFQSPRVYAGVYDEFLALQYKAGLIANSPVVDNAVIDRLSSDFRTFEKRYKGVIKSNSSFADKFRLAKNATLVNLKLKQCLGETDEASIGGKVMRLAFQVDPDFTCGDVGSGSIADLSREIDAAIQPLQIEDAAKKLAAQVRFNAASSYADMMMRMASSGVETRAQAAQEAVQGICQGGCSREEATRLRAKVLASLSKSYLDSSGKKSSEDVARDINRFHRERNNDLKCYLEAKTEEGVDACYKVYRENYLEGSSSATDILIHTKAIGEKARSLMGFDPKRDYRFKWALNKRRHQTNISANDVSKAYTEFVERMRGIGKELNSNSAKMKSEALFSGTFTGYTIEDQEQDFAELAETHPLAIAQVLMENPGHIPMFCRLINKAEKRRRDIRSNRKTQDWVLMVSGGLLIGVGVAISATGVGSVVGLPMIAAGGVLTGASTGVAVHRYMESSEEISRLADAQLAGTDRGEDALIRKRQLENEMATASEDLGLTIVGSLAGAALGAGAKASSFMERPNLGLAKVSEDLSEITGVPVTAKELREIAVSRADFINSLPVDLRANFTEEIKHFLVLSQRLPQAERQLWEQALREAQGGEDVFNNINQLGRAVRAHCSRPR